jgi:hypothetical protein
MEAVGSSEECLHFHQTTRHDTQEDGILQINLDMAVIYFEQMSGVID